MEDRRDLDPVSPGRRPATVAATPPDYELGGPGTARDPARRDTKNAAPGAAAAGDPDTILRWHRDIVRRRRAAGSMRGKIGRPATRRNIKVLGPPAGAGEPRMGIPQDPRGTGRAGSQDRGVDRLGDSQDQQHRPGAATDRSDLVAVPTLPGRGDPGAASSSSTCWMAPRPTSWP
jgi:hypothetical protein